MVLDFVDGFCVAKGCRSHRKKEDYVKSGRNKIDLVIKNKISCVGQMKRPTAPNSQNSS